MQNNFDDIRPYLNSEIQVVFRQLLGNDEVLAGASAVMPIALIDDLKRNYKQISDIDTFQERYMYPMLENLKKIKKTEITFSGTDNISQPAMFLSNHRDILTDSAFLQYVLGVFFHIRDDFFPIRVGFQITRFEPNQDIADTVNFIKKKRKCLNRLSNQRWEPERSRSEERRVGKECRSRWSPYH